MLASLNIQDKPSMNEKKMEQEKEIYKTYKNFNNDKLWYDDMENI